MLSIVCVYNKRDVLDNNLLVSLKKQINVEMEYILIDSEKQKFSSAAEALNYAGELGKGEYIIFAHQDVVLEDNNTLSKIEKYCQQYKFGIAGIAGIVEEGGKNAVVSKAVHGNKRIPVATREGFDEPLDAYTLDECLLIIPKSIFTKYKFTNLGKTWHLYATDFALQMRKRGQRVLVLPVSIWHKSMGDSMDSSYFDTIFNLARVYRHDYKVIYTIFGFWPTAIVPLSLKCMYRKMRLRLRGA